MKQEHPKARAIDAVDAETWELVDELSRREGGVASVTASSPPPGFLPALHAS